MSLEKQDLLTSCCDHGDQKSPSCQHSRLMGTVSSEIMSPLWGSLEPVSSGDQGTTKATPFPPIQKDQLNSHLHGHRSVLRPNHSMTSYMSVPCIPPPPFLSFQGLLPKPHPGELIPPEFYPRVCFPQQYHLAQLPHTSSDTILSHQKHTDTLGWGLLN